MQTMTMKITARAFAEALAGDWLNPDRREARRASYLALPEDVLAWAEQHAASSRNRETSLVRQKDS